MNKIIFTHIPKTAGSSFRENVIIPNFDKKEIFMVNGLRKAYKARKKTYKIITGHVPYGIHIVLNGIPYHYITFLRNPIERAISHYYFVLQTNSHNYEHPEYDVHRNYSLKEIFIYNRKRHGLFSYSTKGLVDNLMTRYISGYGYSLLSRRENSMLNRAQHNLINNYKVFGIQEYYDESIKIFSEYFNWNYKASTALQKTNNKPLIDEETLEIIKEHHKLDIELYNFALEYFKTFL